MNKSKLSLKMIPELFFVWIIFIVTFALGFLTGYIKSGLDEGKSPRQIAKDLTRDTEEVGPVHRPSAEQLEKRKDKRAMEEDAAMTETLDKIIGQE